MLSEFAESMLGSMLNIPPNQAVTAKGRRVIADCYRLVAAKCGEHEADALRAEYEMARAATFPNA